MIFQAGTRKQREKANIFSINRTINQQSTKQIEEMNYTVMNDEEVNQLLRSRNRQKDQSNGKNSFKEKLISSDSTIKHLDFKCNSFRNISLEDENTNPENHLNFILISAQDKERLYKPWKQSIIIKLLGRRLGYIQLRDKIHRLWRSSESQNLIDLGNDFYLTKFISQDNHSKVLQ